MRSRWVMSTLVAVAMLLAPSAGAGTLTSGPPDASEPLYWLVDPDGEGGIEVGDAVHNSSAQIWRDETGISFKVRTTGLTKGHGYTIWFFSYDNPEACLTGDGNPGTRCTGADLLNPAALGSIMWGRDGTFVTGNGTTTFSGHRPANTTPCLTEPVVVDEDCSGVLAGHGLHNPLEAEIHFVLRDHGPDQEEVDDETSTINGGCDPATHEGLPIFGPGWGTPGTYACFDPQGNN